MSWREFSSERVYFSLSFLLFLPPLDRPACLGKTETQASLQSTALSVETGNPDPRGREIPACWSLGHDFPLALQLDSGWSPAAVPGLHALSCPRAYPPVQGSPHTQTSPPQKLQSPRPPFYGVGRAPSPLVCNCRSLTEFMKMGVSVLPERKVTPKGISPQTASERGLSTGLIHSESEKQICGQR